jgi:predicted dehydrogenase
MTDPIRIGIAGAGFAARFHMTGYQRVYGVPLTVTGATSNTTASREKFAREYGVRAFDSLEQLCDASDVIDVCTPGSSHEAVAVEALKRGKHVIIEKPFTGYYGPPNKGGEKFRGNTFPKETMLREAMASCRRILEAARKSGKMIGYAEDWVYAPAIQKEREILEQSGGQILWVMGGCSHSGSHSPYYGIWKFSGGGSIVGKGCHPLSAALYLKGVEGNARDGKPIRPATVSARTHEITQLKGFQDAGFIRRGYEDIEDYSQMHITFTDGMVVDIFATELVLGGVHNWLEVFANNHRTRCNLNPIDALETFNPKEDFFKDVYITEKISSKQGWSHPAPDEAWQHGYLAEFQDFLESIRDNREPLANGLLASDTTAVLYAAYLSAERHGQEVDVPLE